MIPSDYYVSVPAQTCVTDNNIDPYALYQVEPPTYADHGIYDFDYAPYYRTSMHVEQRPVWLSEELVDNSVSFENTFAVAHQFSPPHSPDNYDNTVFSTPVGELYVNPCRYPIADNCITQNVTHGDDTFPDDRYILHEATAPPARTDCAQVDATQLYTPLTSIDTSMTEMCELPSNEGPLAATSVDDARQSSAAHDLRPFTSSIASGPSDSDVFVYSRRNVKAPREKELVYLPHTDRWKCPHCSHVQQNRRLTDLRRHIKSHTRSDEAPLWICSGVPLDIALDMGVPEEVVKNSPAFEVNGMLMVGGCKTALSRRDALIRHLRSHKGKCFSTVGTLDQRGNRLEVGKN